MSAPSVTAAAMAADEAANSHAAAQAAAQAATQHLDQIRGRIQAGDQTVSTSDLREAADRAEYADLAIASFEAEAKAAAFQHRRAKAAAAAARAADSATGLRARDGAVAKAEAEITAAVRKLRASLSARDDLIGAVHGELGAAARSDLDDEGVLPAGYGAHSLASGLSIDVDGVRHRLSTHDSQFERRIGASVRAGIADPIPGGGPNQDQMPSGFRGDYVTHALLR